jgi:RNA methyltransferase, TrmH family
MPFHIVHLTSTQNPLLQSIRQAARRSHPLEDGSFLAEGPHLVEELLRSKWKPERLVCTPEVFPAWQSRAEEMGIECILVPARVFASLSATETSQGILALVQPRPSSWEDLRGTLSLVVVLDGVQDPGNAGTIIRSAEAFGATGVVLLANSVRLFNGKLMRASAGSLFRLPVREQVSAEELVREAHGRQWQLLALVPSAHAVLASHHFKQDCALVVGSEGSGIRPELLAASVPVSIRTSRVESLNAAVACSIALYEASRRLSVPEPV